MTDTLYTPNSTQVPLSHPVQIRDSNRTLHMTTNWLILGVAVVLGPSAMFTFVDFPALFFEKQNGPPPPPAPLLPSSTVPKLEPPTCLNSTDISSFLAVRIDLSTYFFLEKGYCSGS